jgi:hypothetical protein
MMVDKLLMGFPQKAAGSNPAAGTGVIAAQRLTSGVSDPSDCSVDVHAQ